MPATVLDALGDATRRAIVDRLREGSAAVGEIATRLPVSRPAVSQHLRVLESAGLVRFEAAGRRRVYRLDTAGLAELREYVEGLWDGVLDALEAEVERTRGTEGATA